jgi:hypothetical protein
VIAVCLPSRGLVFSETVEEVLREVDRVGRPWRIHWSHGRPIPACFNTITEAALADRRVSHLWFVEEDMGLPEGILGALLARDAHAIAADYPVTTAPSGTILRDPHGRAYFTGTGCLLVAREVLEALEPPVWRSDVAWALEWDDAESRLYAHPRRRTPAEMAVIYGFQDVHFGIDQYRRGRAVEIYDDEVCWQRKLQNLGRRNNNLHGCHEIVETRTVVRAYPASFAAVAPHPSGGPYPYGAPYPYGGAGELPYPYGGGILPRRSAHAPVPDHAEAVDDLVVTGQVPPPA